MATRSACPFSATLPRKSQLLSPGSRGKVQATVPRGSRVAPGLVTESMWTHGPGNISFRTFTANLGVATDTAWGRARRAPGRWPRTEAFPSRPHPRPHGKSNQLFQGRGLGRWERPVGESFNTLSERGRRCPLWWRWEKKAIKLERLPSPCLMEGVTASGWLKAHCPPQLHDSVKSVSHTVGLQCTLGSDEVVRAHCALSQMRFP